MPFKKKIIQFYLFLLVCFPVNAQLEDGAIAPNFILTDINGNEHTLYEYLDQGKTVYIDFFACHCPFCWNYHQTNALSNLFDNYGPGTSTNDVFVFAIELDLNNGTDEFYSISGNTQGNWVEGTNYPQINPEGNLLTQIMNDFSVDYYPLIYAICPNKEITVIGTISTPLLYEHATNCEPLALPEIQNQSTFEYFSETQRIKTKLLEKDLTQNAKLQIRNTSGQIIQEISIENTDFEFKLPDLKSGIYFVALLVNQKLMVAIKVVLF
ncbi:MAG: redoxin domain-containing protein [Flavobacteriales bacterium]|nr:redoxin domain-containing protein [Flavobacteriales bacterium]